MDQIDNHDLLVNFDGFGKTDLTLPYFSPSLIALADHEPLMT